MGSGDGGRAAPRAACTLLLCPTHIPSLALCLTCREQPPPCSPQSPQLSASPAKPLYPSHHGVFLPRIPVGVASTSLHFALCCVQLSSRGLVSQGGWETRQPEPRLLCVCTLSHCVPDPELGRRVCQVTSVMSGSLRPQGL